MSSVKSAKARNGEEGSTDKGPVPREEITSQEAQASLTRSEKAQDSPIPSEEGGGGGDALDLLHATSYAQVARVAAGAGQTSPVEPKPEEVTTPTTEKGQPEGNWT
ncbi:unnamed protein product, partial [Laminaria digitata]